MMNSEKMILLVESSKTSHKMATAAMLCKMFSAIDIPTFDGAEFCGEMSTSDDNLVKIMEMLGTSHQRHASRQRKKKNKHRELREFV